eukprot:scaffold40209_cov22-Prasinocladus_malaysianus.AAC.1
MSHANQGLKKGKYERLDILTHIKSLRHGHDRHLEKLTKKTTRPGGKTAKSNMTGTTRQPTCK